MKDYTPQVGDFLIYSSDNTPFFIEHIVKITPTIITTKVVKVFHNQFINWLDTTLRYDKNTWNPKNYRPLTPIEKIKYL